MIHQSVLEPHSIPAVEHLPTEQDKPSTKFRSILSSTHRDSHAQQWCDYLAYHKLSDFPAYTSAPIDREDEALWVMSHSGFFAPWVESLPYRCLHGQPMGKCAACVDLKRSGKINRHRDNYLNFDGTYEGVESSWVRTSPTEVKKEQKDKGYRAATGGALPPAKPRFNQVTPEDVDWATRDWKHVHGIRASEFAMIRDEQDGALTNWCPTCKEFVVEEHDGSQGILCEEYCRLRTIGETIQRAEQEEDRKAYCATMTAKREARKLRMSQGVGYSPEEFDREILTSRGTVTADAVKQFDRDFSRKGNKYRIR
jgi:hypothetical protein